MKLDLGAPVRRKPAKAVATATAKAPKGTKAMAQAKARKAKEATAKAPSFGFPPPANRRPASRRHKTTVTRVVPRKASRKASKTRVVAEKGT